MLKHITRGIRVIAFLLILVLSLSYLNNLLINKYVYQTNDFQTTSTYNQFYLMEENSVDVLFLGSSVAQNAFIPQEIYNQYGITSYNLSSVMQSMFMSYYWLKEALRFQSPQVVVLDAKFLFNVLPSSDLNTTEGLMRKCFDPMQWSEVKREAVAAACELDNTQTELSYYLTNLRFRGRSVELSEADYCADVVHHELKGYAFRTEDGPATYATYSFGGNDRAREIVPPLMDTYLDKIVELCKQENITLVLTVLPGNKMSDSYNNVLNDYAEKYGIDIYNFCETELFNSLEAELPGENVTNHMNIWGAIKMSDYIGNLLSTVYNVPSVVDEQYEETRDFFDTILGNCSLSHITDVCEYLDAIDNDRYTVFISVMGDSSRGLSDEICEKLSSLGLTEDLRDKYGWSYCAVISPENGISESLSRETITLKGSIRNHRTFYKVQSGGVYSSAGVDGAYIGIDDTDYAVNSGGLNFVVYDNELARVVDSVCFGTGAASCTATR